MKNLASRRYGANNLFCLPFIIIIVELLNHALKLHTPSSPLTLYDLGERISSV